MSSTDPYDPAASSAPPPPPGGTVTPPTPAGVPNPALPPSQPPAEAFPPPQPRRNRAIAGKVVTAIGAFLILLALIGGAIATASLVRTGADIADEGIRSVSGTAVLDVNAGETRMILVEGDRSPIPQCTVLGPGESPLPTKWVGDLNLQWGDTQYSGVSRFTAARTGAHTIECDRDVVVSPDISAGAFVGGIVGIVFAVLTGVLGLLLLIGGVIVWIVQASSRRA